MASRSAAVVMSESAASICWFRNLDLFPRLSESLALRLQPVAGSRQIVGEDLELGPDLARAGVDLLRRVDHGGSDE